jgi:hypothetical protein
VRFRRYCYVICSQVYITGGTNLLSLGSQRFGRFLIASTAAASTPFAFAKAASSSIFVWSASVKRTWYPSVSCASSASSFAVAAAAFAVAAAADAAAADH